MLMSGYTALIYLISVVASFVHGVLGFGYPFISTPLIAMFSDVRSAMLVLVLPTMAINIMSIMRGGNARSVLSQFWPLALFFGLGSLAGTRLLIYTDPEPYKLLLAGIILFYLFIQKKGLKIKWIKQHDTYAMLLFGTIGGLLAGTVNGAIPALIIYTLERNLSPAVSIIVFNVCFLSGKFTQTAMFAEAGLFNMELVILALPLAILSVIGLWIGLKVRGSVDTDRYRLWLQKTLYALSAMLILQYVYDNFIGS
jgi:uncharacterized membrane protein YfcA